MKPHNNNNFVRINGKIKISPVIVISPDGVNLGKFPVDRALQLAASANLDLVEVSPTSRPPVCKIMDYGKYKYEQKVKDKSKNQKTQQLKEIHLGSNIADHDLQTKVNSILKFLNHGDKVHIKLRFKNREMAHKNLGYEIITKILSLCEGVGKANAPKLDGKVLHTIIDPVA